MQGILLLQQQFPKQLFLILSKEFDPSDKLKLELEHVIDSLFITIKHFINEIINTIPNYSGDYSKYNSSPILGNHFLTKPQMFKMTHGNNASMTSIPSFSYSRHVINKLNSRNRNFSKSQSINGLNMKTQIDKKKKTKIIIDTVNLPKPLNIHPLSKHPLQQQYETLKKKAQDKIHRLKDKVVFYQTQLQTYAIESEHLRIIAQEDKLNQPASVKLKLQTILKELHALRQISNSLLLENSKIIIQAKEQLSLCLIYKDIQGTIVKRNKTPPDTTKIKQYYSQTQSIPNSPDRKLKTEKPSLIRIVNPKRTSVSKNLLAEFDVSAQITKFIKQYYQTDQQLRNSAGFQQKLI